MSERCLITTNLIIGRDLEDSPRLLLNSDLPMFSEDDLVALKDKIQRIVAMNGKSCQLKLLDELETALINIDFIMDQE